MTLVKMSIRIEITYIEITMTHHQLKMRHYCDKNLTEEITLVKNECKDKNDICQNQNDVCQNNNDLP